MYWSLFVVGYFSCFFCFCFRNPFCGDLRMGVFSQEVFENPGRLIESILSKTAGITRKIPKEDKVLASLTKIERQLGFSDSELDRAAPLTRADVDSLVRAKFDPLKDRVVREAFDGGDMEAFKTALFQYIANNHLDSPIILRWWDASEGFREIIFPYLTKTHLSGVDGDSRLLLKWWEESILSR